MLVAARTPDPHGRIILDVEWVPKAGGEARTAMGCFTRLAPLVEGAQGVIYDTALRGVHHQTLLRDLGLLPINRVTAAKANPKTPRRAERRIEPPVPAPTCANLVRQFEDAVSMSRVVRSTAWKTNHSLGPDARTPSEQVVR